jgi:hypothetical protein
MREPNVSEQLLSQLGSGRIRGYRKRKRLDRFSRLGHCTLAERDERKQPERGRHGPAAPDPTGA